MLPDRLLEQPLQLCQMLLDPRFLEDPELQVHKRGQSRRNPGVKLAGIDIGDHAQLLFALYAFLVNHG